MKQTCSTALALALAATPVLANGTGPDAVGTPAAFGTSGAIGDSALCDVSGALTASAAGRPAGSLAGPVVFGVEVPNRSPELLLQAHTVHTALDPAIPQPGPAAEPLAPAPAADLNFEGYTQQDNRDLFGFRLAPPDTEGDVGRDHFVSYNNVGLKVFDKAGNELKRCPGNVFWADSTLPADNICVTNNDGDPIVLYDHIKKRWLFSQFAIRDPDGPIGFSLNGHQCVAVSKTPDPLGAYSVYDYEVSPGAINDYPKIGLWPDGYYMTTNEFSSTTGGFAGVNVTVFDRKRLLQGKSDPKFVQFSIPFTGQIPFAFSLQPSHLEGNQQPRRPNLVVQACDDNTWGCEQDGYRLWKVEVDFKKPGRSSIKELSLVSTPKEFDSELCGFSRNCIPQPGIDPNPPFPFFISGLDSLGQFTMYRFQNRFMGSRRLAVLAHTVDTGGDVAGIRWVQFDLTKSSKPSIVDTGTHAPDDGVSRWMPSIAMDRDGNVALGYSRSSETVFPSAYYTGRKAGDPAMTMRDEAVCIDGSGSQQGTTRWGDYSTVSVDPTDGCTFWIHQEYVETTGVFAWNTRVCTFKFPSCRGGDHRHDDDDD